MKINGFIISNKDYSNLVKLEMGSHTFSTSTADAWNKHIGYDKATSLDRPIIIQRWMDRGWKPFKVTLELDLSPDPLDDISDILRGVK